MTRLFSRASRGPRVDQINKNKSLMLICEKGTLLLKSEKPTHFLVFATFAS